jgi:hypothetical protein
MTNHITVMFVVDFQYGPVSDAVKKDVRQLWKDYGLGNDFSYFPWESLEHGEDYPHLNQYLVGESLTMCLIHWWW